MSRGRGVLLLVCGVFLLGASGVGGSCLRAWLLWFRGWGGGRVLAAWVVSLITLVRCKLPSHGWRSVLAHGSARTGAAPSWMTACLRSTGMFYITSVMFRGTVGGVCEDKQQVKVRLGEIDTLESWESYGERSTCGEVTFYLNTCGVGFLDGGKAGIPCEALCG